MLLKARHISTSIARAPDDVYRFVSSYENLPRWAAGLSGSEVVFTLLRKPGITDDQLAEDARFIERDLATLKRLLEGSHADGCDQRSTAK
jgi:hypothetical protein